MATRALRLVSLLAIPLLLTACFTTTPELTSAPPTGTVARTAPPTYTAVSTYTPVPTYTPVSTYTPVPTFTPLPTYTPLPPRPTPVSPADLSELESAMLAAINDARAEAGKPALVLDPALAELARDHAQDMVDRDYRSHVTPEGQTYRARLTERGIEALWARENWYAESCPEDEIVACAMEWFLEDAVHRANILDDYFRRVGIGIVRDSLGVYVIVQDFSD